jgi:serine/threonine-protein kinase RsbW
MLMAEYTPEVKMASGGDAKTARSEFFLTLQVTSDVDVLCVVRAAVERAAEVLHFREAESRAIVLSVDEAMTNVIRHAYEGCGGRPIEIQCRRLWTGLDGDEPGGMEIVIADCGAPASAEKLHSRPLEEIRPGGLGIHFMKQSMDIVEFSRENGRNLLRMVKYLVHSEPEEKLEGV